MDNSNDSNSNHCSNDYSRNNIGFKGLMKSYVIAFLHIGNYFGVWTMDLAISSDKQKLRRVVLDDECQCKTFIVIFH